MSKNNEVCIHPRFAGRLVERIKAHRKALLDAESEVPFAYDTEDCKTRIGPYFSEERAFGDNRYLEMYLAQRSDVEHLIKEVRRMNEQLATLNIKYAQSKAELRKAYTALKKLREDNDNLLEVVEAHVSAKKDADY